jgi:hypothetical protein
MLYRIYTDLGDIEADALQYIHQRSNNLAKNFFRRAKAQPKLKNYLASVLIRFAGGERSGNRQRPCFLLSMNPIPRMKLANSNLLLLTPRN